MSQHARNNPEQYERSKDARAFSTEQQAVIAAAEGKMCEWSMCSEKATVVESCKGMLYNVCVPHRRIINKQKKADNNY